MANSKIRSSTQLFIDANLNLAPDSVNKKVIGVADGVDANDAVNMGQLNALVAASDAMVFKGTVGIAGTITIAALNALTAYNSGWTYKVITAGTIRGIVCEVGDLIISTIDRLAGGVDADWTVIQTNADGVIVKTDFNAAYTILRAEVSGTPTPLVVAPSTFVGRNTTGGIVALTVAQMQTLLSIPANFDLLYWKKSATGDVTISAGDVTTIGASKVATGMVQANALTNAKLAQMAALTMKGNNTGVSSDPLDLTVAQVKTLLSIGTQSAQVRTYRSTLTGAINAVNLTFTVAAGILSGTEEVFKNGQLLNQGAGNDYTISYGATTTISMAVAPSNADGITDVLLINYSV